MRRGRRDDDGVGGVGHHDVPDPAVRQQVEQVGLDGWRDSAANVSGPTKRAADGVSMTDTSAPSARSARSSSTAL